MIALGPLAWGSVSDWLSGVTTVVAVVVALVFSLRTERLQDEQRLAAVYAWFVLGEGPQSANGQLWLHNATDLPIYKWTVNVSWKTDSGKDVSVSTSSETLGLLPPGRFSFGLEGPAPLPNNDALVKVDLEFTDARQRSLRRTPTGKLVRERRLSMRQRAR